MNRRRRIGAKMALPPDVGAEEREVNIARRLMRKETLASFVVAFVILALLLTHLSIDFGDLLTRVQSADPVLYLVAFVVYYLTFPLRAYRWLLLLNNIGIEKSDRTPLPSMPGLAHIIFMGWFANCVVPAKLGDAYRGYLLKKETRVSFSSTMGTVLAERII